MPTPTLALCLEYPLALRGGVSVLVEEFVRRLAPSYRIVLVSADETPPESVASLLTAHVHWNPERVSRETSRALAEHLLALDVALAHFHIGGTYGWGIRIPGQSPIPFLAKAGVPVCTTVHLTVSLLAGYCGPEKPLWFKLAALPIAWLGKMQSLWHARAEIAVSDHDAQQLRRWFAPLADRFRRIYHSRLDGPPPPPLSREKVILNVGHIAFRKGQHLLAEAFAQVAAKHPDWHLELAGPIAESACADRIKAVAATAGVADRVHLLGSRDDAFELMQRAAIYVQPSIHEALGLALQEALHAGCACIGSDSGGIPELITDGENGLLYPCGDVAALATALERLISDSKLRETFARRAPASLTPRDMNATAMVAQYDALYCSLLA